MDAGAMLKVHLNDLFQENNLGPVTLGFVLQDLTRTHMNWNTKHQDPVPLNFQMGDFIRPAASHAESYHFRRLRP